MSQDPTPTASDYMRAEFLVSHLGKNMAADFQINGGRWNRDEMQAHVNKRAALSEVAAMLLDEGERLLKDTQEDGK